MSHLVWIGGLVAVLGCWVPAGAQSGPRLDVAFLIDATGSMADEIDAVKTHIRDMIAQVAAGDPAPDVRFGVVAYRDRGDEYVTRVFPFTRDLDGIVTHLDQVCADGGGDYPESFTEALHQTLNGLEWDRAAGVSRLVFAIADAPPHTDYPDDYDLHQEIRAAEELGVAVQVIGASGLDEEGERVLREVAAGTGGRFQWLAYQSRYVDEQGIEVRVVVEGRAATYTRADSTWTVTGEAALSAAGPVHRAGAEVGMVGGPMSAGADPGAPEATNLDELITGAIVDAARAAGTAYGDGTTAARAWSWGQVKAHTQGR